LDSLKKETKNVLKRTLENATQQHAFLEELSVSLATTEQSMDQSITTNQKEANPFDQLAVLEDKLRTMDHAKSYIKALLVASELSSKALQLVQTSPEQAMTPYVQLVQFEQYIDQQATQQPQYVPLHTHLKKSQMRLREELEAVLVKNFKQTLDTLSWPTQIKPPYGPQLRSKLELFEQAFRHLLMLQTSSSTIQQDEILIPISIMLEGLSLRFRYHFETSKPTNRIDKPEWYLTHVKNAISTHIPFMMTTIQPVVAKHISAKDQFIQGLLQDVNRKLQKTMPQLLTHPNWLSHTVHQVLEFDKLLVEEFAYNDPFSVSRILTNNPVWFNTWFQAEKSFAQSRYDEIMLDRQAFDIYAEDDFDQKDTIKRTKSAVRLVNLLDNITTAYQLVPQLSHKLTFFIHVQLNLLGQYHKRLSTAIDSFEALSLIRSVPVPGSLPEAVTGVMTATETGGTVSALHRLHRWWTSARSMRDALKDWNEDEFFLELQLQSNEDTSCIQQVVDNVPVQERNNCMLNIAHHQTESLFSDATIAFEQLIKRVEKIIVKIAIKDWSTESRKYARKNAWWQNSDFSEISDELYKPLQDLRMTWNYLYRILPQAEFLIIFKQILKEIEDWYWKHIIASSQFSPQGALQLETDIKSGLWKIAQRWSKKPENYTKKLKEAIQLLTLPFEQADNDLPSCGVLMKALSDTNQLEPVQTILDKLGIEVLSNSQIRDVLRRRNDMLYSWS
ncbi:hypothetical protein CU098_012657, partial [Rhizopus stolonifer]